MFDERDDVCVLAEVTCFGPDGQPFIPDVAVIHGVAQSEPTSWRQDRGDRPPSVAIEVVSASENDEVLATKLRRYNDNGVAEVWLLRIRVGTISCYRRVEGALRPVVDNSSVLLGGVRFDVGPDGSIVPLFADGEEFPSHFVVILARAHRAEARLAEAEANAVQAEAQAAHAEAQAAAAIDTVEHLRAQLRAAGITPSA